MQCSVELCLLSQENALKHSDCKGQLDQDLWVSAGLRCPVTSWVSVIDTLAMSKDFKA